MSAAADILADGDASAVPPDARLVHVDCERCEARLEVRVPLALAAAGGEATVRCGACDTLLRVAVLTSLGASPPPAPAPAPDALASALASFHHRRPPPDPPAAAAADDDAAAASLPAASRAALEEQRRHLELARYHMEMATSLHRAARAPPPAPQGSLLAVPPPPPARDDVTRALRDAARDFWLRDEPELPKSWSQTFSRAREPASPPPPGKAPRRDRKARQPSPYNVFIREEIPRLKDRDPGLNHRDAFKAAARNWANSPLNARSAAYVPSRKRAENAERSRAGADAALPTPASSPPSDDPQHMTKADIMDKLHPGLLRSREEDAAAQAAAAGAALEATNVEEEAGGAGKHDDGDDADAPFAAAAAREEDTTADTTTTRPPHEGPGAIPSEAFGDREAGLERKGGGTSEKSTADTELRRPPSAST